MKVWSTRGQQMQRRYHKAVLAGDVLSLKVIWLFEKETDKNQKDFTDFIVKAGGTGQQVLDLIESTNPYQYKIPTTALPPAIQLDSFGQIDDDKYVGKRISVPLYVFGENSEAYHAPTEVDITFCLRQDQSKCHGRDDWDWVCDEPIQISTGTRIQLASVASTDAQLRGALREYVCDKGQRPAVTVQDQDRVTLREVYAHQVLEGGVPSERNEVVEKPVYVMGGDMVPIGQYQATGFVHSHPRNQRPTLLIDQIEPQEEDWQAFDLNNCKDDLIELQALDPIEIIQDLSQNVTRIYEREDIHLGILLTMVSPRWIDFPGDGRIRGWISSIIIGDTGCHAKGTKILMADGKVKAVESLQVGDEIMGKGGIPRQISCLYHGNEPMYRITPVKGESFEVNEHHILSLKNTRKTWVRPSDKEFVNITVEDYLKTNPTFKHLHKLYRSEAIELEEKPLPVDPYFIGLYLGDGHSRAKSGVMLVSITTMDEEVVAEIHKQAKTFGLRVSSRKDKGNKSNDYFIVNQNGGGRKNPLAEIFKDLNLCPSCEGKNIPAIYKFNSIETRLQLLAGLLDSDGHLSSENTYEYLTKSPQLASDTIFVCRSLGLAAYVTEKKVRTYPENVYYRLSISGNTNRIPCRVKIAKERKQIKDVLVTGFSVEPVGNGDFYGFEIGGDHLYLMGDFTVTHNTGKSQSADSLFGYANVGTRVSGMTASRTGITYALEFNERRGWRIKAGALLKMSRQALIVDEAQDLKEFDLKTMAEALDTGQLKIARVESRTFESMTRCLFSCNPRAEDRYANQRSMDSFLYGCQALSDIFPQMMIRRIDLAMFVAGYDIEDKSKIYEPKKSDIPEIVTRENFRGLIHYAWNLKPEQIDISDEVGGLIRSRALELAKKFGQCADLPICYPEDFRKTFCRLVTAFAVLDLASDDSFQTITPAVKHIEYVSDFLNSIYSADNCRLDVYSKRYQETHGVEDPLVIEQMIRDHVALNVERKSRLKEILNELVKVPPGGKQKINQRYFVDQFDVERQTITTDLKPLIRSYLVDSSRGYRPTVRLVPSHMACLWGIRVIMEEKPITSFTVGEPFPGAVPDREGPIMELWEIGLVVLIQFPGLRQRELEAFHQGFKTYSYLESSTPVPIAVWVFDFPKSHGQIDSTFNARFVERDLIDEYLDSGKAGVKNGLYFFLLDKEILRGMKLVGLDPETVELFHGTIRKQLSMDYDRADYEGCLGGLFTHTTRELFDMGRKFEHK